VPHNASEPPERRRLRALLGAGLEALGLGRDPVRERTLLDYLELLSRWNRIYNLTAVSACDAMVTRHLLDSLAVVPHLRGDCFADVGSGAGLPGIPLAIWLTDRRFVLVDSSSRKVRFLRQAQIELRLDNIEVIAARVQDWRPARGFDGVLSRAFASLPEFVAMAGHLLAPTGVCYALKGRWPEPGAKPPGPGQVIAAVHALHIPGLAAPRHLVEIGPRGEQNP
jgi:16S rRNA (guanine527-N7)-methyltransferase